MILFDLYIASIYKIAKNKLILNSIEKINEILSLNFFYYKLNLNHFPNFYINFFKN